MIGEIARHEIDAVRQVFPGAGDAAHVSLTAKPPLAPNLAGDPGDFRSKRAELIHHRVDRVLEFEDFSADVDGDLAREIAFGDRRGDFRDIAHLAGQIAGHKVHVVGQVFPCTRNASYLRLSPQLSFRAHLARNPCHFRGKRTKLIDHGIDRIFQLKNFTFDVDGDFLREISLGDRRGHLGDIADLCGQIPGHGIDAIGQIFPCAGDPAHVRLSALIFLPSRLHGRPESLPRRKS